MTYDAPAVTPGPMRCTLSGHTSSCWIRGVHDSGCGSVTNPVVGLRAEIATRTVLPVCTEIFSGAVHTSALSGDSFGAVGGGVVVFSAGGSGLLAPTATRGGRAGLSCSAGT